MNDFFLPSPKLLSGSGCLRTHFLRLFFGGVRSHADERLFLELFSQSVGTPQSVALEGEPIVYHAEVNFGTQRSLPRCDVEQTIKQTNKQNNKLTN